MEMTGERRIPAPRQQVWDALNDPEVLKAAIPGCDSLEQTADNAFSATVTAKVGPVKAKFSGNVTLSDIDPPNGYTIAGEGKGGAAGFAKGGASVRLEEDGGETVLRYEVKANVGGKLAQLGSRLIDGAAKKQADDFFASFTELAASYGGAAATAPAAEAEAEAAPDAAPETPAEPAAPATADQAPAAPAAEPAASQAAPVPAGESERRAEPPADEGGGLPSWVWVGGLLVLVAIGLYVFA